MVREYKTSKQLQECRKKFSIRNAPITDLLENNENIKTIYQIILLICLHNLISYLMESKK